MEDMNFGPKSIDAQTATSSDGSTQKLIDGSTEKSIDTPLPIPIDAILPEAGNEEEHVDLIDETGFRKQRLADQQRNMSFTRTYEAGQTHRSKLESMIGQVLKRLQKMSAVLDERLDSVYSDLHNKFETLSDHVKKLDSQVAHNAGFVRRDEGFLPGKTDTNPRRQVCAVLLRSGKQLSLSAVEITSAEKPPEAEKETIHLDEKEEESEEDVEIDQQ
ncbi:hypothetical protein F2Q68_00043045 [Brassica cretica]|uniref:Uncharacterized protein n=1 Tax=Brassica cretica TaxID=69181 RepID=A0A8S9LNK4_BRACR|nr:hypothetical protein F2Q68_00043045 [Brassica cretica]